MKYFKLFIKVGWLGTIVILVTGMITAFVSDLLAYAQKKEQRKIPNRNSN